jgi:hypothetical protein
MPTAPRIATTFGDDRGIVELHVNDETELITIYRVVWAG